MLRGGGVRRKGRQPFFSFFLGEKWGDGCLNLSFLELERESDTFGDKIGVFEISAGFTKKAAPGEVAYPFGEWRVEAPGVRKAKFGDVHPWDELTHKPLQSNETVEFERSSAVLAAR